VLVLLLVLVSDRAFALETSAAIATGPEGGWITALAVSPSFDTDGKLWTAAFGGRIYASSDAAATWSESHAGETDPVVVGLATSPNFSSDGTVFAAADEGVFRSVNGGNSWGATSAGLVHHFGRAIVVSPSYASDHTVFVATDGGVYRSSDSGSSWSPPTDDTRSVISLAEVTRGTAAGTLYAGLDAGGLEQSSDGGEHWQTVQAFPTSRRVLGILSVAGTSVSSLVVATDDGIWRSSDAGSTWQQVGAQGDRVDALTTGSSTASLPVLYAGSAGGLGVYASIDSGATWSRVGAPSVPFVTTLATAGSSELVAGTTGGGIFVSSDGGFTWRQSSHRLYASQSASLRAVGSSLIVAGNGGAYVKNSSSVEWRALGLSSHFVTAMDGRNGDLFAGTQDTGLMISNDAGLSWHHGSLIGSAVSQVALSPNNRKAYTLLVAGDYVYRSVDGGASFSRATNLAGNDVHSFSFSPEFGNDGTVFAGTLNHGVYRSSDGGATWLPASAGLPPFPITNVLTSSSFSQDRTVYAATAGNGVLISSNGGSTWSPLAPAVPDAVVDALAWTRSGQLVAGTEHGIFLLDPSGWSHIGNGWDGYVSTLQDMIENGSEYLYAGTIGQGVWETTLGTFVATPTSTPAQVSTVSASATLTTTSTPLTVSVPTSIPIAKPTPKSTSGVRPLVLHLRADPVPVVAHRPALLSARGPAGGRIQVRLVAHGWQRKFSGTLGRDGRVAFGFVSPALEISVVAQVSDRGRTSSAKLVIPVSNG
jgi:hypothetical protein